MAETTLDADVGTIDVKIEFEGGIPLWEFMLFFAALTDAAKKSQALAGYRLEVLEMRSGSLKTKIIARRIAAAITVFGAATAAISSAEKPMSTLANAAQVAEFMSEIVGKFLPEPDRKVPVVDMTCQLAETNGVHSVQLSATGAACIEIYKDGLRRMDGVDDPPPRADPPTYAARKSGKQKLDTSYIDNTQRRSEWRKRTEAGLPPGFKLFDDGKVEIEATVHSDDGRSMFLYDPSGGRIELKDARFREPALVPSSRYRLLGRLTKAGTLAFSIQRAEMLEGEA